MDSFQASSFSYVKQECIQDLPKLFFLKQNEIVIYIMWDPFFIVCWLFFLWVGSHAATVDCKVAELQRVTLNPWFSWLCLHSVVFTGISQHPWPYMGLGNKPGASSILDHHSNIWEYLRFSMIYDLSQSYDWDLVLDTISTKSMLFIMTWVPLLLELL